MMCICILSEYTGMPKRFFLSPAASVMVAVEVCTVSICSLLQCRQFSDFQLTENQTKHKGQQSKGSLPQQTINHQSLIMEYMSDQIRK